MKPPKVSQAWQSLSIQSVLQELDTDPERGLPREDACGRVFEDGPNEIPRARSVGPWPVLLRQFKSVMIAVLLIGAVVSFLSRDCQDAAAILAMLLLTTLLGFWQEYRAERAMAALESLAAPTARVLRSGVASTIPARELVRGDIVLVEAGDIVPADLRLLEVHGLKTDESTLTGESHPAEKDPSFLAEPVAALGDLVNMAYSGTTVTAGRGRGIVVTTGQQTEIGRISGMLGGQTRQLTPLQIGLEKVGRKLVLIALAVVGIIFVQGLVRGEGIKTLLLTSISLAVAAVPEGLPAVIVIALALGSQRMLARRALIRRLAAVETLGSITVICSDKTGTLTQNRLTVTQAYVDGEHIELGKVHDSEPALRILLTAAALSTDATCLHSAQTPAKRTWAGDPTEVALVRAAAEAGIDKEAIERLLPRIDELPFDSTRKRMTTVHRLVNSQEISRLLPMETGISHVAITKGAFEGLLPRITGIWSHGKIEHLPSDGPSLLAKSHDRMATEGMRVLCITLRPLRSPMSDKAELESDLVFVGFLGLHDPPRPEAKDAVTRCKEAGITPVMVTGDHALTAQRIARDLGIGNGAPALAGMDLMQLSKEDGLKKLLNTAVVARVSPEDKLILVETLQQAGQVVAMTGDGINDAPALARADVSVAMGCIGTDVARGASDVVLQDDNFATIVAAVEEGRLINSNIRKFFRYLLSCNSGELWLIFLAPIFAMPLPLTPLQILWINLVTDGLPALALANEPAEADAMRRPPRSPKQELLGTGAILSILSSGLLLGLVAFLSGYAYWRFQRTEWQTVVFAVAVFSQLAMALGCRSESQSVFRLAPSSNRFMIYAITTTVALQLIVMYIPFAERVFHSEPLGVGSLMLTLAISTVPLLGLEMGKWLVRRGFRCSR